MNIWIVNQYAIPPSQAGITRHYMLGRELARQGHDVTLIAASFDHLRRVETRLQPGEAWRLEAIGEVRFLWLRTPPYRGNGAARIANMAAFAARLWWPSTTAMLPRPHVIVGSSPTLFAAYAALRLARRRRVPFVLEVRDLWPKSLVHLGQISDRHPIVRALEWLEQSLYGNAAQILTLLPNAVEHMVGKGALRERITWLPNGVDLASEPEPVPPRESDTFTFTYAGAHGLANALHTVVEAAAMLAAEHDHRIRFRFIGDGPEKLRLQQQAARLANVRFDPPRPKQDMFAELARSDAFIVNMQNVPLYGYGISLNKIYDYMAAARPIVFAAACANPIADSGCGLVVAPESPRELAAACRSLAARPAEERWRMGLRGRHYVEQHHSMAVLGARLNRVLRLAAGSTPAMESAIAAFPVHH